MSSAIVEALPNRPMSRNQLYAMESREGIRYTRPYTAPWDDDTEQIECFMIVGEGKTAAVGFDEEEQSWTELQRERTPENAFTGAFITNEDDNHPEIQRISDAMSNWGE